MLPFGCDPLRLRFGCCICLRTTDLTATRLGSFIPFSCHTAYHLRTHCLLLTTGCHTCTTFHFSPTARFTPHHAATVHSPPPVLHTHSYTSVAYHLALCARVYHAAQHRFLRCWISTATPAAHAPLTFTAYHTGYLAVHALSRLPHTSHTLSPAYTTGCTPAIYLPAHRILPPGLGLDLTFCRMRFTHHFVTTHLPPPSSAPTPGRLRCRSAHVFLPYCTAPPRVFAPVAWFYLAFTSSLLACRDTCLPDRSVFWIIPGSLLRYSRVLPHTTPLFVGPQLRMRTRVPSSFLRCYAHTHTCRLTRLDRTLLRYTSTCSYGLVRTHTHLHSALHTRCAFTHGYSTLDLVGYLMHLTFTATYCLRSRRSRFTRVLRTYYTSALLAHATSRGSHFSAYTTHWFGSSR